MNDNVMTRATALLTVWLFAVCFSTSQSFCQDERTRYFPKHRDYSAKLPEKENLWIFVMAGQSNMAGRGIVTPEDTIPDERVLSINAANEIIIAKEPLHFYEPNLTGLDCGLSFAKHLLIKVPKNVSILMLPLAVGGSSSRQWLGDSLHRNVKLLSNFRKRVEHASKYGTVKAILWHQGESDTGEESIPGYDVRMKDLFKILRGYCGKRSLPILVGELGAYSDSPDQWKKINASIHKLASSDKNIHVIPTGDLKSKEDKIHFNSEGQRQMGKRMAEVFLSLVKN
jgi:hypothetical protein